MSALDEVLREYFDTDGDKEVYNEAVSDLVGLIATAKQVTQLRTALDKVQKAIKTYVEAGMHTHGDIVPVSDTLQCPRCIAKDCLSAWLKEFGGRDERKR